MCLWCSEFGASHRVYCKIHQFLKVRKAFFYFLFMWLKKALIHFRLSVIMITMRVMINVIRQLTNNTFKWKVAVGVLEIISNCNVTNMALTSELILVLKNRFKVIHQQ